MRIVIKIGTTTLAHATGHLNIRRVEELCKIMSDIKNAGHEVILVSSGAIGMGVGKLGLRQRPPIGRLCLVILCRSLYTKAGACVNTETVSKF